MLDRLPSTARENPLPEPEAELEPREEGRSGAGRPGPRHRRLLWVAVVLGVLLLALALFWSRLDGILRRTLEAKINQRLQGYTVSLAHAHLSPLGLALTLQGMTIRQNAHPEPPVAALPRLTASVEWRQLLSWHLVADAIFESPRIHVNLPQLRAEDRDRVDVQDRGWQQALESIYPLKFDRLEVRDGDIVYVDEDPRHPLHVSHWNLTAGNIRNIHSRDRVYPSPVHTDGVVFDTGRAVADGHADFLAEPYPGIHAVYRVEKVPLDQLRPLGERANLSLHGGSLDSHGEIEFGPKHREAHIADVTVSGLRVDYVHTAATSGAEGKRAGEVAKVAKDPQPTLPYLIDRLRLTGGELGLVDRSREKPYRVFLDHTDLEVTNFSSGFRRGPAKAKLTARFMGHGAARGNATFRAAKRGADFDLSVAVEKASLPSINDLLRSYGKLDVVKGTFSVYSEISVHGGRITGYVKPLFEDVDVYDPKQDKHKPVLRKLYEKVVEGVSKILKNQPRDEVATKADISGSIDDPNTSVWEIFVRLLSNAFVKAILPGFDHEVDAWRHRR